jgi:hypothetical protein
MSYSTRNDRFVSHLTKREYIFETRGQGAAASKAKAKAAMERDHRAIEAASEQRHGRPLSLREQLRGGPTPEDQRSIRQRIEEEATHAERPEQPANPYSARLAELTKQLRHSRFQKDRNSIQRKIDALQEASNAFDDKAAAKKAWNEMMASAEVEKHIQHATTYLERLLLDPATPEMEIIAARNRLAKIKATGDVAGYREQYKAAETMAKDSLRQRSEEMEAALAELKKQFGMEAGLGEATNGLLEAGALHVSGDAPIDE